MKLTELAAEQKAALAAKVLELRDAGESCARVAISAPAALGFEGLTLNHTQVDWITYEARITPADRAAWAKAGEDLGARTVWGRENGLSWGWMAVLNSTPEAKCPESRIRAAYAAATSTKSQGQRIGKGGRFYYQEHVLYEDVLKPTGTVIPVEAKGRAAAIQASQIQRFVRLPIEGQDRIASQMGLPVRAKGESLTRWQAKVIAMLEGKEQAPAKKGRSKKAAPVAEAAIAEAEAEAAADEAEVQEEVAG